MKAKLRTVWALHGFLGLPSDWDDLSAQMQAPNLHFVKVNLYDKIEDFSTWSSNFNKKVRAQPGEHHLLGYSLGGRLALHSLVDSLTDSATSRLWKTATIVSANPGIDLSEEIARRREADRVWAEKFLEKKWGEVLLEWNSQSVFSDSVSVGLERSESDFVRADLSSAMRTWSLSNQQNLREKLAHNSVPVRWVAGEKDPKFKQLAEEAESLSDAFESVIISEAGHRVPWDQPQAFYRQLSEFIDRN